MTEAPERIWRVKPWTPDQAKHGLASWTTKEEAGDGATEYVRADTLPASPAPVWRDRIYQSLRSYQMSNMCFEDMPDVPFPLVDLMSDGNAIDSGEREMELLADFIAGDLIAHPSAPGSQPTEQPPQADVQALGKLQKSLTERYEAILKDETTQEPDTGAVNASDETHRALEEIEDIMATVETLRTVAGEQPPQADVQVAAAHVLASGFNSETNQRIATAMALVLRADIDPSAWNTDCELLNAFSAALRALAGEE